MKMPVDFPLFITYEECEIRDFAIATIATLKELYRFGGCFSNKIHAYQLEFVVDHEFAPFDSYDCQKFNLTNSVVILTLNGKPPSVAMVKRYLKANKLKLAPVWPMGAKTYKEQHVTKSSIRRIR